MDAIQNGLSNYVFREACGDGHESVDDFELLIWIRLLLR
jgi:hypothetical protein